jgi:hypothetical protein
MNGQVLQAAVNDQAKEQPEDAEQNAVRQQGVTTDTEELDLMEVWQLQIGFAGGCFSRGLG